MTRSYLYQLSRRRSAFAKPFVWWVREPLDLARMQAAAARLTGMHDFQAFSDDDPDKKSTEVLVDEVTLVEDGDLILIRVAGSHFIWKMVRRMVGVLAAIGKGGMAVEDIDRLLSPAAPVRLKPDATSPGATVAAGGAPRCFWIATRTSDRISSSVIRRTPIDRQCR